MKRKKKVILFLLVAALSFFTWRTLLRPGYFPMHDDMQAFRVLEMDKCFRDGQFPCRWVPDMGFGYGYPQFNYYSPLPYYVMEFFHLLGFGFLDCVKIGFALSFIFSAWGMFLLASCFWGDLGGLVAAVFYLYAPYRAMDVYNRGAMAEAWAFIFLPFIFYFIFQIWQTGREKKAVFLALSLAGLFLSHNITSLIVSPFVLAWIVLLWVFWGKNRENFKLLVPGFALGVGLSAFFLLPAVAEKRFAHVETMLSGYFNYLAHFVSLRQLFLDTHWGYGSSVLGPNEDLNFSVGIFQWVVALVGGVSIFLSGREKRKKILVTFFFLEFLLTIYMVHLRSSWVWEKIPLLSWLQFPWRFLTLSVFFLAILTGSAVSVIENTNRRKILGFFLISLAILANVFFFRPASWLNINDDIKFSGRLWEKQLTISIFDYLPIYAKAPPGLKAPDLPWAVEGEIKVGSFQKGTDWQEGKLIVLSDQSFVRLPLFYFPGWQVKIDGKKTLIDYNNELGLISFRLERGEHEFTVRLLDTWPRKMGNLVSLISLLVIIWILFLLRRKPRLSSRE